MPNNDQRITKQQFQPDDARPRSRAGEFLLDISTEASKLEDVDSDGPETRWDAPGENRETALSAPEVCVSRFWIN